MAPQDDVPGQPAAPGAGLPFAQLLQRLQSRRPTDGPDVR
jgi:hypothetical protein